MAIEQTALSDGTTQSPDMALSFTAASMALLLSCCQTKTSALDHTIGAGIVDVEPVDVEAALREELSAWEAAGDEAFYLIEKLSE